MDKKGKLVIREFGGINDAVDAVVLPPPFTSWIMGAYVNSRKQLTKVPGKVLISTGVGAFRVLTLQQLSFSDSESVFVRAFTSVGSQSSVSELMSPQPSYDDQYPGIYGL